MKLTRFHGIFLILALSLYNTIVSTSGSYKEGLLNQLFQDGQRLDPSGKKIAPERNDNKLELLPIYNSNCEFNLLVTYWDKHNRIDDFKISLEQNIKNPLIKKIYVFYEKFSGVKPYFLESPKVVIIPIPEIAKHKDFYEFANQNLEGQIIIMANADIYFDQSLEKLKYVNFDTFNVALTRYNYFKSKRTSDEMCHDTWIFRAPIRYKNSNYRFNRFGTEHLLVHDWITNKYKVINPCLSIITHHVHKSDYRDPFVVRGFDECPIYFLKFETLLESLAPNKIYPTQPLFIHKIKP